MATKTERIKAVASAIAATECSLPEEDAVRYAQAAIEADPMTEDVKRLVECLQFYAAKENYKNTEPQWDRSTAPPTMHYPLGYPDAKVFYDAGKLAQNELEKWSGE